VAQQRRRSVLVRTVVAVAVATALLTPAASDAQQPPNPDPNPAETERRLGEVRAQRGQVDLDVNALTAENAEVTAAVATLETNVANQQAAVDEAQRAADEAEADVATATQAVNDEQARIDALNLATDDLVVESYVNPPSDNSLDAFKADSLSDAAVKQALVDIQADSDADLLDQLQQAHEDLAVDQANKEELAAEAETKRQDAEDALTDLQNALAQQQAFADDLEERLNAKLAEAESLRAFDAQLADQLVREQEQVAANLRAIAAAAEAQRQAEAAAAARAAAASGRPARSSGGGGGSAGAGGGGGDVAPSVIAPAPGGLATVTCPHGGSITVAGSIAGNVQALLNAAAAAGVSLCASSGWRSPQRQIELRRAHCGSSNYAIYQMPASQCQPPTARPGSSMHEQGLAIDFSCNGGGAITRGNSCWNFLVAHASDYGLYNLASETWHWSTNGR
jgi:peptidoglycan hydrolase CwlO-like protein